MHLDLTISLGNILTVLALLGVIWRVDNILRKFIIEHEILMSWYCKAHNITLQEVPTRVKGLFR